MKRLLWLALVVLPGWLLMVWCSRPPAALPRDLEADRLLGAKFRNLSDSVAYVGKETCRTCHAAIYDTYMETGMGRSWGMAPSHSRAKFDGIPTTVYDTALHLWYQALKRDSLMYIREFRLSSTGDTLHQRLEKVDMVVGSGHHTNSHLMWRHGRLCQMPLTYYTQDGRWDLPPGFERGNNSRFARPIEAECINCHNAHPVPMPGGSNSYASIPDGIDCERCHGPGGEHVREKSAGILIDTSKGPDYSIVNPRRLSAGLQNDLCKRCHLQGNAVLREGKKFSDFKPGMVLSDVFAVFLPRHQNHEDYFIMASHPDRMAQSACLQENPLAMQCISCHNPHKSVFKTNALQYNKTCMSCHGDGLKDESTHPEAPCTHPASLRSAKQNRCVDCHMPKSGSSDIPHVQITDHKIQVPASGAVLGKQKTPSKGILLGLASLNLDKPEPLLMARAWLQYVERFEGEKSGLDSAKYWLSLIPKGGQSKAWFESSVHLLYLKGQAKHLPSLVQSHAKLANPSACDAWTSYRIGAMYTQLDDPAKASPYLARAVQAMPLSSEFKLKKALNDFRLARRIVAVQELEDLLRQDPTHVPAYANLGYLYLLEGRPDRADQCYRKALALDPDHPQTLLNRAGLMMYLQRPSEARRILQTMLERYPGDARALALLGQTTSKVP